MSKNTTNSDAPVVDENALSKDERRAYIKAALEAAASGAASIDWQKKGTYTLPCGTVVQRR